MTGGPRVEAIGLTKLFHGRPALQQASFRLEGPRTVGYLGPNGAGKTTTLKLLTGLLRPSAGHAQIDGIDVGADPKRALAEVGAVIESPEPYPELTVREAIRLAGRFRGLSNESIAARTVRLNEQLVLPPLDQRCGKLSKGQRQRTVLAAALVAEPPILLLDEPTSGLDPAERVRVRRLLKERGSTGLVLLSSHLLPEVTEICDDVLFVNQGRIVRSGSVADITAAIRVREVDVEFAVPVAIPQLDALRPLTDRAVQLTPRRYRFGFDGETATRIRILIACQTVAPVLEYTATGSALEGVYLELMEGPGGLAVPPPGPAPPPIPPPPPPPP